MTQEELNELMASGNFDDDNKVSKASSDTSFLNEDSYKVDAENKWPPPPPTENHMVVHQLDDVTKGIEIKATQIFDHLETISSNSEDTLKNMKDVIKHLDAQKALFGRLSMQFPNIDTFKTSLASCNDAINKLSTITSSIQSCADSSLEAMDIMQYQDIHRQKIERVVNVMRAVAKYLNSILDTDVDDSKRVASARHLSGDNNDTVSTQDLEDLIASFEKK